MAFYATKLSCCCCCCCCNCSCYKRMCCWQYSTSWLLLLLHSYFATIERVLTRIVPILAAAIRYIGRIVVVLTCCWFGLPLLWSCCQWWPLWHSRMRMRRRTMPCSMLCLLLLSTGGLFYTSCDAMRCDAAALLPMKQTCRNGSTEFNFGDAGTTAGCWPTADTEELWWSRQSEAINLKSWQSFVMRSISTYS